MLPSFEVRLTTAWVKEQDQWKSLQIISRRCRNYRDDMEEGCSLESLGYPLNGRLQAPQSHVSLSPIHHCLPAWQDCEQDFCHAYHRLKVLKERADSLMQAMTGLASIAGNRQNLQEAKHVKRPNLLALACLFASWARRASHMVMTPGPRPKRRVRTRGFTRRAKQGR